MKRIRGSELRNRGRIEQRTETRDARSGEVLVAWSTLYTVAMKVAPLTGREFHAAAAGQSEVDTRITMRYRAGVTPKCRVVVCGVTYDIKAVLDLEMRHQWLELMCSTGVTDG